MALSYVSAGAGATGTTTMAPALGAGWAPDDLGVLVVVNAHEDGLVPEVAGTGEWQYRGSEISTAGAFAAGTGPRRLSYFTRVLVAGEVAPTVTLPSATGNALVGVVLVLRKAANEAWSVYSPVYADDTSSGTTFTATASRVPSSLTTGAMAVVGYAAAQGSGQSLTAPTATATGATLSALSQRLNGGTANGYTAHLNVSTATVSSGTATAAPTMGVTAAVATTGIIGMLVVRATTSTLTAVQDTTGEALRRNWFTNPGAEGNVTTGWGIQTNNGTGVLDTVDVLEEGLPLPPSGAGRFAFRATAPIPAAGGTLGISQTLAKTVAAGQQVTVSFDAYVPTTNPATAMQVQFLSQTVPTVTCTPAIQKGVWQRYTATITTNAALSIIRVKSEGGSQSGTQAYFDNLMLEVGTLVAGDYFDGDTPTVGRVNLWTATPRLSESQQYRSTSIPRVGITLLDWGTDDPTTVYRVHKDGTRVPVRGGDLTPSGGAAFVWDYEFPTNEEIYYVASDSGTERTTAALDEVITRRNGVRNPVLTVDATDWAVTAGGKGTAAGARVLGSTTDGPVIRGVRRNYYRMTWSAVTDGTPGSTGIVYGSSTSTQVEASPGPWTQSVYWRGNVVDRTCYAAVTFYDAANAAIGAEVPGTVSGPTMGLWMRATIATVAPAGTTHAVVRLLNVGGANNTTSTTLDATGLLVEDDVATVGTYFDGDTAGEGYRWQSTPSLSFSEKAETNVPTPLRVMDARCFLRAPGLPGLDMAVRFQRVPNSSRPRPVTYLAPLGRRTLVPQAGARQAPQFTLDIWTETLPEGDDLIAFMEGSADAYVLFPGTRYHGMYVSLGDLAEVPREKVGMDDAAWQVPAVERVRPAGGVAYDPSSSWQTVLSTSSSWQAVLNTYPSWLDVLRGPATIEEEADTTVVEPAPEIIDGGTPGSSGGTVVDGGSP